MKKICLFILCTLAGSLVCAQSTTQSIHRLMDKLYKNNQFNGSILVADQGRVVFHKSYGWADLPALDTLRNDDAFHVAEISNQFTAMAVAMLVERGKLRFEDDISLYLTELPYQGIRVKDLIYHTSGLPDYVDLCEKYWEDKDQPITNQDLLAIFRSHEPTLEFKPGDEFLFSNTGYAFLATLVERIALQSFGEFLHEKIFLPLGMEHSFLFQYSLADTFPKRVKPYRLSMVKAYVEDTPTYLEGITGDKGVYTSTGDLYKWSQALHTSMLLPIARVRELFKPGKLNNNTPLYYAAGWVVLNDPPVAFHDGTWGGFNSTIVRYPHSRNTIILLSNRGDRVVAIQRIISKILEGQPFRRPRSTMTETLTRQRFKKKYLIDKGKGSTL